MKKILSLILSLVMLLSVTAGLNLTAKAETANSGKCGENVTYSLDSSTGELTISGIGNMDNYNYYDSNNPFYDNYVIKTITISSGVTSIGDFAFNGCTNLTNVTIPDSVTSIGDRAFERCTRLKSINVDTNNKNYLSIDGILFNKDKTRLIEYPQASAITEYNIPNSVTSIGDDTFYGCTSLTSVTIPDSVTSIGYSAFRGCTSLTSVIIPNSVTSIGDSAFCGCTSLTSITIPNSVTSIGYCVFSGCTSLKSVTIPDSVTSIGWGAFNGCTSLKDVYYLGTKAEWDNINIGDVNDCLTDATLHCTDDVKPQPTPNPTPQPTPQPTTPQPSVPTTQAQQTTQAQSNSAQKPKSTKTKKVKSSKKAIAVEWVKTKGVKGYEIQVATDKKFKKNKKTVTVKKQKTTKTTVKKLKAKKKYYVRVRTYKIVNGKKVYSSWSKVKSVKTK